MTAAAASVIRCRSGRGGWHHRLIPFGKAICAIHHQAMVVLRQHMPQVVKPGFAVLAITIRVGLWIGSRGMGLVAALLAVEIPVRVAAAVRRARFLPPYSFVSRQGCT